MRVHQRHAFAGAKLPLQPGRCLHVALVRQKGLPVCPTAHMGRTSLSEKYNEDMQAAMGWDNPYEYHFDRGLYYHEIVDNLICGSQPRNSDDVQYLHDNERVTTILNLQQDKDLQYWGVDFGALHQRASQLGMRLVRRPARDFDPNSLRSGLPSAVAALERALSEGHRVYVHCTAGLGRAPAVCIAFLYWFRELQLDEAYSHLTAIRPCGPKRDAIRGATYDLMTRGDWHQFDHLPSDAWASLGPHDRQHIQHKVREAHHNGHHHHRRHH